LPYLTGERTPYPDPNARGVFFGLTLRHDKRHMTRAVMEGVGYSLRDCLELFRDLDVPVHQVRAIGGGARSVAWRQMLADIFGTEMVTVNVTDGAPYGAALLAGVGTGVYDSVTQACEATVRIVDRIEPNAANQNLYNEYYPIYRSLYAALKTTFADVAAVE
ncbi:MAG TPA: xylulokinase, partial [Chloroflexi bacterium]|nr:xylulokinase [Chloroflexota bacterium]